MSFPKYSKRLGQFEVLEAKKLFAADIWWGLLRRRKLRSLIPLTVQISVDSKMRTSWTVFLKKCLSTVTGQRRLL